MPSHDPQPGKCGARLTNGSGMFCSHEAGWGTDHKGFGQCRKHGGATRNGKKAAVKAEARGWLAQLADRCSVVVEGRTIAESMDDVINRTGAMALAWYEILGELQQNSDWCFEEHKGQRGGLDRWVVVQVAGLLGPNAQGELAVHVADEQYRRWLADYLRAVKAAADLGLEERKVRLAEQQGEQITRVIEAVLRDHGVDPSKAGESVARHLRAVG